MIKTLVEIWKDFFNQEPVVKGSVQIITQKPPPDPIYSGKWGTAVPQNQIKVNIVCNKCRKKKK